MYYHLTSVTVETPRYTLTGNSSFIGKEPASSIRSLATSSLVSSAEQGIIIFTNVLQDHVTVVLVCCISECDPDITYTWEGRATNVIMFHLIMTVMNAHCEDCVARSLGCRARIEYGDAIGV